MQSYLPLFLSLQGRITRRVFARAWLILTCADYALIFATGQSLGLWSVVVGWLLTLYPSVCVYSHRLRDLERSSWWQAFPRISTGLMLTLIVLSSNGQPWLYNVMMRYAGQYPVLVGVTGLSIMATLIIGVLCEIAMVCWLALAPGKSQAADVFE